jgi:hypothetical protein
LKAKDKRIYDVLQSYVDYNAKTIGDWVAAQRLATKSQQNPRPMKRVLIDIFDRIQLDPHLTAVLQSRTSRVMSETFEIVENGEVNVVKTELVNKQWLQEFFLGVMRSRYYGYTLFEIGDLTLDGELTNLIEIDRRNVIPENNAVMMNPWDFINTIDINDSEEADYLFLVKDTSYSFGILNKAVPAIIRKLYAQTAWVEHAQIAGLPLLFGKLKEPNETKVAQLLENLATLARNGVGVGSDGDTVDVLNRSGSGHAIYKDLVETENSEITKLVLSQTGTTEANGSYAQSKTHKTVADEIAQEDKSYCTNAFNAFIPKLIKLGYPLTGCKGRFQPDTSADPETIKNAIELLKYYVMEPDEVKRLTGITVETKMTKSKPTE